MSVEHREETKGIKLQGRMVNNVYWESQYRAHAPFKHREIKCGGISYVLQQSYGV